MVTVTSDSPQIEKAFNNLLDTLRQAGSGFHSQLQISVVNKNITLSTKEAMSRGKEMIRIPRAALMPSDQYAIALVGDNFVVDYFLNTTVTQVQRTIIEQMFEIYNLTAKVAEHKDICFLYSLRDYPTLMEKFSKNRMTNPKYQEWYKGLQEGMDEVLFKQFLIDTFIQTRPLGYNDPIREDNVSTIMPIIDFLNHHWDGANFSVVSGVREGDLTIASSQPIEGNNECFAFYGVLDACDSLLRYNFVDESAPIIRSIKLELEVPDGRKILIDNKGHDPKIHEPLPAELSDLIYYTPQFKFTEDEGKQPEEQDMQLSFVIIPLKESMAPLGMRRVIKYTIEHMYSNFDQDITFDVQEWALAAEEKILNVNAEDYESLLKHVDELVEEKGASDSLLRMRILAKAQLKKIAAYKENIKSYDTAAAA